jgi:hypothetical protein
MGLCTEEVASTLNIYRAKIVGGVQKTTTHTNDLSSMLILVLREGKKQISSRSKLTIVEAEKNCLIYLISLVFQRDTLDISGT